MSTQPSSEGNGEPGGASNSGDDGSFDPLTKKTPPKGGTTVPKPSVSTSTSVSTNKTKGFPPPVVKPATKK